MAFLLKILMNLVYIAATLVYPGYNAYQSIQNNKTDRLWLWYFLVFGVKLALCSTILYPLKYLLSCVCLEKIVNTLFAVWLYHPKYRGALLIEQYSSKYLELAVKKAEPIASKVLVFVGFPVRSSEPNKKTE